MHITCITINAVVALLVMHRQSFLMLGVERMCKDCCTSCHTRLSTFVKRLLYALSSCDATDVDKELGIRDGDHVDSRKGFLDGSNKEREC